MASSAATATAGSFGEFRPASLPLATIGLSLATFMQVLDITIANVSLPTIAGNLGASLTQSTWVITSFAVSNAIALPLTGFLSRRFGEVKLFVWATALFSICSLACGFATSMGELVLFRALQGAVAGPMYPLTQSLMVSIYPREKRGMALAILAMVTVVAPIAGPVLGGWITETYSWEWIFFHHRARKKTDRHVDEEDPFPRIGLGDPAAQYRPRDRRDHRHHREDRQRHPAFFAWIDRHHETLRERIHRPRDRALQRPEQHQFTHAGGEAAGQRTDREQRGRPHEQLHFTEAP